MKRDRDGKKTATVRTERPPPPPPRAPSSRYGKEATDVQAQEPPPPPPRAYSAPYSRDPAAGQVQEPPPPPPRVSSARDKGEATTGQAQEPPPPPPRVLPANGVASAQHFPSLSAQIIPNGGAHRSTASSASQPGSSSSSSQPTASKKPRHDLDPPSGWRTAADEILSRAAGGVNSGWVSVGGVPNTSKDAARKQSSGDMKVGLGPVARSRRKFATVCSANFNRSMMAHKLLQENQFHVQSFGTGRDVRLPGKDISSPEVFAFGTPYRDIFDTLKNKDEAFFRKNKLLGLVARNAAIKAAPQRFQEIGGPEVEKFDVVLCFDSRVFYLVVEDLQSRDPETFKALHVVNMNIKDSPEESAAAANDVLDLCRMLDQVSQLEEAPSVLDAFTKKTKRAILHQVCHV